MGDTVTSSKTTKTGETTMAKYKVNLARTTWLTVNVEADNEDDALDQAYAEAPEFTAQESGWGSFGKWSADAAEWQPVDEWWGSDYDEKAHGPVVEESDD